MQSDLSIITTSDGSHSLFNKSLNETYHSIHGAIQESQHVFINAGLNYWKTHEVEKNISILEIGFGTGLNAFLTLLNPSTVDNIIYYESWEAYPLPADVFTKLNYPNTLGFPNEFESIHKASWGSPVSLSDRFTIRKVKKNLLQNDLNATPFFDIIFYDAFGPSKQPEMWTLDTLQKVVSRLTKNGLFVTYCAKGQVKRDLRSLGLNVESIPGPPGKLQMIRASKL